MEMRKFNRKYNAYCGGTWNIKIERARLNMAYVKLLTAIALKPNCTRREAYTFAYGSFLNTAGKEFSACVWTSLRKSGLIDEFIVKEFMGNWHHTYALTEKGKKCLEYAFANSITANVTKNAMERIRANRING